MGGCTRSLSASFIRGECKLTHDECKLSHDECKLTHIACERPTKPVIGAVCLVFRWQSQIGTAGTMSRHSMSGRLKKKAMKTKKCFPHMRLPG